MEHAPLPPGSPSGVAGLKQFVSGLRATFPDFRYTVEDVLGEGDRVALRVRASGTMKGDFMGMRATGKSASWEEIHCCRMRDGKLAEHWANVDQLGMLQQLGLAPTPGQ